MIDELIRDLEDLVKKLPGLSTGKQIEELNIISATTRWVADHLNANLAFERRREEFYNDQD